MAKKKIKKKVFRKGAKARKGGRTKKKAAAHLPVTALSSPCVCWGKGNDEVQGL